MKRLFKIFHIHNHNRYVEQMYRDFDNRYLVVKCRCGKAKIVVCDADLILGLSIPRSDIRMTLNQLKAKYSIVDTTQEYINKLKYS